MSTDADQLPTANGFTATDCSSISGLGDNNSCQTQHWLPWKMTFSDPEWFLLDQLQKQSRVEAAFQHEMNSNRQCTDEEKGDHRTARKMKSEKGTKMAEIERNSLLRVFHVQFNPVSAMLDMIVLTTKTDLSGDFHEMTRGSNFFEMTGIDLHLKPCWKRRLMKHFHQDENNPCAFAHATTCHMGTNC